MDDDLVNMYAQQAKDSLRQEAEKRIEESILDPEEELRLKNSLLTDLIDTDYLVPGLLTRLGEVRAALTGHGGGIECVAAVKNDNGIDLVLDLTGACLSCGAAPGTLDGIKKDLENDPEVWRVRFDSKLLDTFDELGREFILAHGNVEFV